MNIGLLLCLGIKLVYTNTHDDLVIFDIKKDKTRPPIPNKSRFTQHKSEKRQRLFQVSFSYLETLRGFYSQLLNVLRCNILGDESCDMDDHVSEKNNPSAIKEVKMNEPSVRNRFILMVPSKIDIKAHDIPRSSEVNPELKAKLEVIVVKNEKLGESNSQPPVESDENIVPQDQKSIEISTKKLMIIPEEDTIETVNPEGIIILVDDVQTHILSEKTVQSENTVTPESNAILTLDNIQNIETNINKSINIPEDKTIEITDHDVDIQAPAEIQIDSVLPIIVMQTVYGDDPIPEQTGSGLFQGRTVFEVPDIINTRSSTPMSRFKLQYTKNIPSLRSCLKNRQFIHEKKFVDAYQSSQHNSIYINNNVSPLKCTKKGLIYNSNTFTLKEPIKFHQYQNNKPSVKQNFTTDFAICDEILLIFGGINQELHNILNSIINDEIKTIAVILEAQHTNFSSSTINLIRSKIFRNNIFYEKVMDNLFSTITSNTSSIIQRITDDSLDKNELISKTDEILGTLKISILNIHKDLCIFTDDIPKSLLKCNKLIYNNIIKKISDCTSYDPLLSNIKLDEFEDILNNINLYNQNYNIKLNLLLNNSISALKNVFIDKIKEKGYIQECIDAINNGFEIAGNNLHEISEAGFGFIIDSMTGKIEEIKKSLFDSLVKIFESISEKISAIFKKNKGILVSEMLRVFEKNNEEVLKKVLCYLTA